MKRPLRSANLCAAAVLFRCIVTAAIQPVGNIVVQVDPAATETTVALTILSSEAPAEVALDLTDWKNSFFPDSGIAIQPKVTFGPPASAVTQSPFRVQIPATGKLDVPLKLSGLNLPGTTVASIRANNAEIGSLRIIRTSTPLSIKLDDTDPILLSRHSTPIGQFLRGQMNVTNSDLMPYSVLWRLRIGAVTLTGKEILLAKQTQVIPIEAGAAQTDGVFGKWGWLPGLMKDDIRDAFLDATLPDGTSRSAPIRAKVRLRYHGTFGWLTSNIILILTLFAGAATSLVLKLTLPNMRRKLELLESLDRLAIQTADLSANINPRPIFFLRIQLRRLRDVLTRRVPGSRNTWSPDFDDVAARCLAISSRLARTMDLLTAVDRSVRTMYSLIYRGLQPPSLLDAADEKIGKAVDLASRLNVSDLELAQMEVLSLEIAKLVLQMEQRTCEVLPKIRSNLDRIKALYMPLFSDQPTPGACLPDPDMAVAAKRLRAAWPPVFSVVVCPPALPDEIAFDDLVAIDTDVSRLAIVQRYIELRPPEGTDCESRLVEMLKKESWQAIRALRNWVLQAEQRVSVAELETALKDGHAFIRSNRQEIQTGDPVEFGLRFYDDNLNRAAARDAIRCVWHFKQTSNLDTKWRRRAKRLRLPIPKPAAPHPDTPESEKGQILDMKSWYVLQSLRWAGTYHVSVTFLHNDGETIVANGGPLKIEDDFHVRWLPFDRRGPRLNMELSNMVVALLPALVALIATAENAIAKAEWYTGLAAVFALGFGVDQLKNLITSPPKQS